MTGGRHAVTCNGRMVPLASTGVPGEFVGGRALSRVEPAVGAASDHRRARAADVRPRRHLGAARARRLHVSRRAPGRPQLRHVPGQRQRSRGAARRALLGARPHAGTDARLSRAAESGDAGHAGPALATASGTAPPLHGACRLDRHAIARSRAPAARRRARRRRWCILARRASARGSCRARSRAASSSHPA